MSAKELWLLIKSDLYRYLPPYLYGTKVGNNRLFQRFVYEYIKREAFYYMFWFRIGHYFVEKKKRGIIIWVLKHKHRRHCQRLGVQIELETQIGPSFRIAHYSNIAFSNKVIIGANCTIHQGVTIGRSFNKDGGAPVLSDSVIVFPNSVIIGNIKVGANSIICAGSIVTKDVNPNSVVAGNPAKTMNICREDCIANENRWFFGF